MSFIVALTGGIGSGKSTVSELFSRLGVPIIDADIIARQVVTPGSPALQQIEQHFGPQILLTDGQLNRPLLRELIFNSPQEKRWLDQLLHPLIQQETQKQFREQQAPYLLWVIPLLVENHLTHYANRILVVDVEQNTQLNRVAKRDQVEPQQIKNILAAQTAREARLSYADDIIYNEGNFAELEYQVNKLHQLYLTLATTQPVG